MIEYLSVLLFFIGFIYITFLIYSLTRRQSGISSLFSLLCLAVAIYVIGYGFEIHSASLDQMVFFIRLEYFGAPFITSFWLLIACKFHFRKSPRFAISFAVMTVPMVTLFLTVTNDYHHLVYTDIHSIMADGHRIALLAKGPWFFVYIVYSYIAFMIGFAVFFSSWRKALYMMKKEAFLLLLGSVFPIVFNFIYLIGLSPYGMDLEPFGLSLSAVFFFIAIYKYEFLDRGEIVRSAAFSETSEGIFFLDEKGRLVDFNAAAMGVFPWLEEKNIGREIACLPEAKDIYSQRYHHFQIEVDQGESVKYYEFRVSEVKKRNKQLGTVYYFRDITKIKQLLQVLDDLASHDVLSQVYTRRRFMEEAEKEVARASRQKGQVSILMIDIDLFKQINDSYGHPAGDEVIRKVAGIFKESIRRTDIIGRYGGEEFIIMLSGPDPGNSVKIAESIRLAVENLNVTFDGKEIKTTVSIGVAYAAADDGDIDMKKIIKTADMFLYQAKSLGRNRVCSSIDVN